MSSGRVRELPRSDSCFCTSSNDSPAHGCPQQGQEPDNHNSTYSYVIPCPRWRECHPPCKQPEGIPAEAGPQVRLPVPVSWRWAFPQEELRRTPPALACGPFGMGVTLLLAGDLCAPGPSVSLMGRPAWASGAGEMVGGRGGGRAGK